MRSQKFISLFVAILLGGLCNFIQGASEKASASNAHNQISQKAELKQLFSFTGSTKPCMGWSLIDSGNGIIWSLINVSILQADGLCSEPTWRLIKESATGSSVIRITNIGIPDAGLMLHDYFKVNSLGQANILWRDSKGIHLTVVNPDATTHSVTLDKFACKDGNAVLNFDGPNPLVTWTPTRTGDIAAQALCDSLIVANISLDDYSVDYKQIMWGDSPPIQWSGMLTNTLYTEILNRTLFVCAIRSYPIDSTNSNLPLYNGAHLVTYDLDTHQTVSNLLKSYVDGTTINTCGFKADSQRKDMAVMLFGLYPTPKEIYRSVKAESDAPWLNTDLAIDCSYSYGQTGVYFHYCPGKGSIYPDYSEGILRFFGPDEPTLTNMIPGPNGYSFFYRSAGFSGENENGHVAGFGLTYVGYLGDKSSVDRGDIELTSWCNPAQPDLKCTLKSNAIDAMKVSAVWSDNQPTFFVLALDGNEITYSKVMNPTLATPTIQSLSLEQSAGSTLTISAIQVSDGISPIQSYSWQHSPDNISWSNLEKENDYFIIIPPNTSTKSDFYRVLAKNSIGWSKPSYFIEVKGLGKPSVSSRKTTISCIKGKTLKKVIAVKPVCPKGYKKV